MSDDVESALSLAIRLRVSGINLGFDPVEAIEARDRLVAQRERERCTELLLQMAAKLSDSGWPVYKAQGQALWQAATEIAALPDEEPSK